MSDRPNSDLLSQVANVAGIGSLIMAVASGNLEKLSELQRWGLASAAIVLIWFFMMTALFKVARTSRNDEYRLDPRSLLTMLVGGLVLGGVLLALVPFFSFGLPVADIERLSMWAAGSFVAVAIPLAFAAASE